MHLFGSSDQVTCGAVLESKGVCTLEPFHYGLHKDTTTGVKWGTSEQQRQDQTLHPDEWPE